MGCSERLAIAAQQGQPFDHSGIGLRESKVASNAYSCARPRSIHRLTRSKNGILHLFHSQPAIVTGRSAACERAGRLSCSATNIVAGCLRHTDAFGWRETSRAARILIERGGS